MSSGTSVGGRVTLIQQSGIKFNMFAFLSIGVDGYRRAYMYVPMSARPSVPLSVCLSV